MYKLLKNGNILLSKIKFAESLIERLVGLMFISDLKEHDGLIINSCKSVHTCFMKYNLDIIFFVEKEYGCKNIKRC